MSAVDAPIGLKSQLQEPFMMQQLERFVTVGGNDVRRCARCPVISSEIDPELACKVYEEFVDITLES